MLDWFAWYLGTPLGIGSKVETKFLLNIIAFFSYILQTRLTMIYYVFLNHGIQEDSPCTYDIYFYIRYQLCIKHKII